MQNKELTLYDKPKYTYQKNKPGQYWSKIDRPKKTVYTSSKNVLVDEAGAVPTKIRIEEMVMAGQRLKEARKEQFDIYGQRPTDGDNPVPVVPITRRRGVDTFKVMDAFKEVSGRLKETRKKMDAQAVENDRKKLKDELKKELDAEKVSEPVEGSKSGSDGGSEPQK